MSYLNPDPMDFPNVHIETPDIVSPTREINVDRRGLQRRAKKRKKKTEDKSLIENMDVDIDVSLEIYDDHEHKHTIFSEKHLIDRRV